MNCRMTEDPIQVILIDKFHPKVNKEIFLRYFNISKAYRVYNSRTLILEETINVQFDYFDQSNWKLSDVED